MVKGGNVVCEFHYQQLRKRTNIWSCPLTSPFSTQSDTPITTRLEKVRLIINQGHGGAQVFGKTSTKTLATKTTYKKSEEKTLDILKGCHLLLHILGLQTSFIWIINNKINDDIILTCVHEKITNLKKNNRAKWRWSVMQNSVGVQPDSMDGQCD